MLQHSIAAYQQKGASARYRIPHLMKAPENDQAEDRPLYSLRVVGMRITVLFICKEQEEGRTGDADVN